MNSDDLAEYITEKNIDAQLVHLAQETLTVADAAAAVGVDPSNIGKSILFLAGGEPIMVIANGPSRLPYKPIARHLGLSRRQLKLANGEEVLEFTGYLVGTVPPFGHKAVFPVLISDSVMDVDEIYAGGGSENVLLKIKSSDLVEITNGKLVTLTE